jgi:hypothetical protein
MKLTIHSFFAERKQNLTLSFLFGLQAALPDNNGEVLSFSKPVINSVESLVTFLGGLITFSGSLITIVGRLITFSGRQVVFLGRPITFSGRVITFIGRPVTMLFGVLQNLPWHLQKLSVKIQNQKPYLLGLFRFINISYKSSNKLFQTQFKL